VSAYHGVPTGTVAAFRMRPTTAPSASTSKSSSFHSWARGDLNGDGREDIRHPIPKVRAEMQANTTHVLRTDGIGVGGAMSIRDAFIVSLLGMFGYTSTAYANSCSNVDVIGERVSLGYMRLEHFVLRGKGMKANSLCLTSLR